MTRQIDPVALERARMAEVTCGQVPDPGLPHDSLVYVTLQELATRIAHRNTGKLLDDPVGYAVMKRVAADENPLPLPVAPCRRDRAQDRIETVPGDQAPGARFRMPGTGIIDFDEHARAIARAGIYDFPGPPR